MERGVGIIFMEKVAISLEKVVLDYDVEADVLYISFGKPRREIIYRSEKIEEQLLKDLAALAALPNVKYIPLTPDIAVASVYLRKTLNLTFFDSHYAATALNQDGKILSFDQAYDRIPGLTRIKPETT